MADDRYRRTDGGAAQAAARAEPANDPLVELARLIGQSDPGPYEPVRPARRAAPEPRLSEPRFDAREPAPSAAEPRVPELRVPELRAEPFDPFAGDAVASPAADPAGRVEPPMTARHTAGFRTTGSRATDFGTSASGTGASGTRAFGTSGSGASDRRDAGWPGTSADDEDRAAEPRYSGYTEPPRPSASSSRADTALGRLAASQLAADAQAATAAAAADPYAADPYARSDGWPQSYPAEQPAAGGRQEPRLDAPDYQEQAFQAPVHTAAPDPHAEADSYGAPGSAAYGAAAYGATPQVPAYPQAEAARDPRYDARYDPRYAPAADGAYEAGEYAEPEQAYAYGSGAPYGTHAEQRPSGGRRKLMAAAAILALAVVGTAGAYGVRMLRGEGHSGAPPVIHADAGPKKIASAGQNGDKQIYERVQPAQDERIVPREEEPVSLQSQSGATGSASFPDTTANLPPSVSAPATVPATPPTGSAGSATAPKTIRTVTIRPDGERVESSVPAARPLSSSNARNVHSAPAAEPANNGNAPLSIVPQPAPSGRDAAAPSRQQRTAMVTPEPVTRGGFVVQLAAQKSESDARASFRILQRKYPSVLGGRDVLVKRKDLGSRGVFYGTQVGPFASRGDAVQLCENLKSIGGNCIVQRN
ncbi:Sporulation related protein [Rhodovulum sp. PH10]|uniref:SPOR domain-containing protein n=1 Tax=Rhodovulum sp. PH10 TaxID=1187851 RepID=UPI00027C28F2|nr:SPOR domain-containing protein [Rhodovulum sp. PH10]EJW12202.1 Sporulation related protein [Rhodovulum sp. PH10]